MPEDFADKNLTSLDLSRKQLTESPPEIGNLTNLTNLTYLHLMETPLTAPPLEIKNLKPNMQFDTRRAMMWIGIGR